MSAWIVSPRLITVLVDGAIRHGVIELEKAQETGQMLTRANVKSIRARYGSHDVGAAAVKPYRYPGPADGQRKVTFYDYAAKANTTVPVDDVLLLKQVHCYGYQTCEYEGYETSPAGRFVEKMVAVLEKAGVSRDSRGYDRAPWGV